VIDIMGKDYNDNEYNDEYYYLYKKYKGQPIEVITESGFKYCGIFVANYDRYIEIIDGNGRTIRIEKRKIEAIVEPRMKLHRLCDDDNCCCDDDDDDEKCCN